MQHDDFKRLKAEIERNKNKSAVPNRDPAYVNSTAFVLIRQRRGSSAEKEGEVGEEAEVKAILCIG